LAELRQQTSVPVTFARNPADIRAVARAVQANVFQLKVSEARRKGLSPADHALRVPSPGSVTRFREILIERDMLGTYSDFELRLRLHETWGRFCLLHWYFHLTMPDGPADLANLPRDTPGRCAAELDIKHAEIHAFLWRLRFEQSRRHDPEFTAQPRFKSDNVVALRIPVAPFGKTVEDCADEELLLAACEHAGMLATLRWIMDATREWSAPGIMDVAERPFP